MGGRGTPSPSPHPEVTIQRVPKGPPQAFVQDFARDWRLTNILPSRYAWAVNFNGRRSRVVHTREHFHLLVVVSGDGTASGERQTWPLRPGEMLVVPPEFSLRLLSEPGNRLHVFQFQLELSHSALVPIHPLHQIELPAAVRHPAPASMAKHLQGLELLRTKPEVSDFETVACLHQLLARFFSVGFAHGLLKPRREIPRWLLLAHRIVETSSCTGPVLAAQLSETVGRSVSSIRHGFREYFGISISEAVRRRRIHQAHSLLASNRLITIEHLASRCGYKSRSHFHRDFTKLMGISPGALRRERRAVDRSTPPGS